MVVFATTLTSSLWDPGDPGALVPSMEEVPIKATPPVGLVGAGDPGGCEDGEAELLSSPVPPPLPTPGDDDGGPLADDDGGPLAVLPGMGDR